MNYYKIFPVIPEHAIIMPEPMSDPACDRLFDALDTLRHEAFALQNRLFGAPPEARDHLERLLSHNEAKQAAIRRNLSQFGYVF